MATHNHYRVNRLAHTPSSVNTELGTWRDYSKTEINSNNLVYSKDLIILYFVKNELDFPDTKLRCFATLNHKQI